MPTLFKKLPRSFYQQPTLRVATALLGKIVCRSVNGSLLTGRITETEAYDARIDPACHAYRGQTARNAAMFGEAGTAYVYFTYGNHFMFNVVTEAKDIAAAVLIRAIEPLSGLDEMQQRRGRISRTEDLTNGPGKLTAAFGIDRSLNGIWLDTPQLFIADAPDVPKNKIATSSRIGISQGVALQWRFYIRENKFVSKGKPSDAVVKNAR
jgi:DNA-3-methyladenine glycosylase